MLINTDNFNIVNFTVFGAVWPLRKLLNLFVNCFRLMLEIIYKKYFELVLQNQNRNRIIKNKSGEIPVLFIIKKIGSISNDINPAKTENLFLSSENIITCHVYGGHRITLWLPRGFQSV